MGTGVHSAEKAGDTWTGTINGVKFTMVYCPPGTFMMGSTPAQQADALAKKMWPWAVKCETLHKVTLTKGFWMLDTQVSQELYKAVTGSTPAKLVFSGQLHEWCLDHCKRELGPDKKPVTMVVTDTYVDGIVDPFCKVGDEEKLRVCRNEGFEFGAIFCRVAFRELFPERARIANLGFRFVKADPIEDK
jgi:formylglycine-generating enzyme required for sulfatase activity